MILYLRHSANRRPTTSVVLAILFAVGASAACSRRSPLLPEERKASASKVQNSGSAGGNTNSSTYNAQMELRPNGSTFATAGSESQRVQVTFNLALDPAGASGPMTVVISGLNSQQAQQFVQQPLPTQPGAASVIGQFLGSQAFVNLGKSFVGLFKGGNTPIAPVAQSQNSSEADAQAARAAVNSYRDEYDQALANAEASYNSSNGTTEAAAQPQPDTAGYYDQYEELALVGVPGTQGGVVNPQQNAAPPQPQPTTQRLPPLAVRLPLIVAKSACPPVVVLAQCTKLVFIGPVNGSTVGLALVRAGGVWLGSAEIQTGTETVAGTEVSSR